MDSSAAICLDRRQRRHRMMVYQTTFYPNANTLSQAMNVTIAAGEERSAVDLQLKLSPAFIVSGSVQGPDGPMPNMPLRLQPGGFDELVVEGRLLETASTVSDAFGQFTFLGVPRAIYGSTRSAHRASHRPRLCSPPPPGGVAGAVPRLDLLARRPIRRSARIPLRSAMRTFTASREG